MEEDRQTALIAAQVRAICDPINVSGKEHSG